MTNVKVNLSITLPGSVLHSEEESSKNSFTIKNVGPHHSELTVRMRDCKPASQMIHLSLEAYNYMTAKSKKREDDLKNCPAFSTPGNWFMKSEKERLEAHLKQICHDLGGETFTYSILED